MAKNVQLCPRWARLVIYVVLIIAAACIVWGAVRHQVIDNTADIVEIKTVIIPKIDTMKLNKEVFRMYLQQEEKAEEKRDKFLERMDEKLDKALEK